MKCPKIHFFSLENYRICFERHNRRSLVWELYVAGFQKSVGLSGIEAETLVLISGW